MSILADHMFLHDATLQFILAVAGLILGIVIIVQSRLINLAGWGISVLALALVAEWWPT